MEIQSIAIGTPPESAQVISGTGNGFQKTLAETAGGQPNVVTTWIKTPLAFFARFGSVFMLTLMGQLGAGAVKVIPLQTWHDASIISLSAALVGLGWSLVTWFANLEKKYPIVSQLT